uniref:Gag-pol protein n=1 Tax=Solanum tuberosum TaxID=4113 RepID=M1DU93_SOLTU
MRLDEDPLRARICRVASQDMNTTVNPGRMEEEIVNEGFHPQGLQGSQVILGNQGNQVPVDPPAMTNEEVRSALYMMAQAVSTQAQAMTVQENRGLEANVNPNVSTKASCLRDFVRMNTLIFLRSKVGDDPQVFFDEVYKIINAMGVTSIEKAELVAYQLNDIA